MTGTATPHKAGSHQWRQLTAAAMASQLTRRRRMGSGVGECNGGVDDGIAIWLQYTIGGRGR